ncbi:DUF2061 domain-containing protein [Alteromonas sp. KUL42]|uniref:DUF2061 domain-containing protein n=1 Tax=Alteromonas sp. KUL42 TaxID=2480797 RepID=UPI0027D94C36|nr:DUF2061 domain-containing protein [Alteromonas sp. KUL42]
MTFAIMHFFVAFSVTYLLTGSIAVGGAVALIEPAINTIAFYFHEKVWEKRDQINRQSLRKPALLDSSLLDSFL